VFEKVNGGPLLTRIQEHIHFTEREASQIIRDLASALQFLHVKGECHFKRVLMFWDLLKKMCVIYALQYYGKLVNVL
jgi:serine/threonine protein kinase